METAIWKIKDIRPAPYNPREELKPGEEEWEALSKSVHRFGLVEPLIINTTTGLLVSGHQRLNVLKAQGATEAEVVLVAMTPENEKLLNISLNKIEGEWDYEKLEALFDGIEAKDVEFTGFSTDELMNLFGDASADKVDFGDTDPEDVKGMYDEAQQDAEDGDEEEPEPEKPQEPDSLREFNIFLSFPTKELAEKFLKDRGVDLTYEGTARNITIRMEGLDYGTGN